MEKQLTIVLALFAVVGSALQHIPNNLVKKSVLNVSQVTVKSCGLSKVQNDGDRVVGGRDALKGEFPWQVSLRFKAFFIKPTHICGATVLNEKWVITAAHCVEGRSPYNFEVAVGVHQQSQKDEFTSSHPVAEIITHQDFNHDTFENDVALLRLKTRISMIKSGGYVNGICLPHLYQNVSGYATTTGWGTTTEGGEPADTLQAVDVPLLSLNECRSEFGSDDAIKESMLCAGEKEGGTDSCQGDSGGPLFQRIGGRSTLVGIVSWGIGCARPGLPGVYTSVPHFVDWMVTHVY